MQLTAAQAGTGVQRAAGHRTIGKRVNPSPNTRCHTHVPLQLPKELLLWGVLAIVVPLDRERGRARRELGRVDGALGDFLLAAFDEVCATHGCAWQALGHAQPQRRAMGKPTSSRRLTLQALVVQVVLLPLRLHLALNVLSILHPSRRTSRRGAGRTMSRLQTGLCLALRQACGPAGKKTA